MNIDGIRYALLAGIEYLVGDVSSPSLLVEMLGVIYSSVFDFSVFSNPRPACSSGVCYENHRTSIEERYCPKQHIQDITDEEWDTLLSRGTQLLDESEPDTLPYLTDDVSVEKMGDETGDEANVQEDNDHLEVPPPTPVSAISTHSTPSLVADNDSEDGCHDSEGNDSDYEVHYPERPALSTSVSSSSVSNSKKRKRGKTSRPSIFRKRLCRTSSSTSVSTVSSVLSSASSSTALLQSMLDSENPWKCPHCPWVQTTKRLPDFLRHQRSHFVSQSDWPCPNPKCGKGFARKDSLKRHLDNRSTGCSRPPGYIIC